MTEIQRNTHLSSSDTEPSLSLTLAGSALSELGGVHTFHSSWYGGYWLVDTTILSPYRMKLLRVNDVAGGEQLFSERKRTRTTTTINADV